MGHRLCYVMLFGAMVMLTLMLLVYNLSFTGSTTRRLDSSRPRRMRIEELMGPSHDNEQRPLADERGTAAHKPPTLNQANVETHATRETGNTRDGALSNIHTKKPSGNAEMGIKHDTLTRQDQEVPGKTRHGLGDNGDAERVPKHHELPQTVNVQNVQYLPQSGPRIFCLLFTTLATWPSRARAVKDTWAKRCHVYRFFYTPHDGHKLPQGETVPLEVPDGRDHLTAKTVHALRYAYEKYAQSVDWFFKADDDTYVIMENLRFVAAQFEPTQAHYIGGRSMDILKHGYNGGGAGYLLSREAARLIVEEGPKRPGQCKQDGGVEDLDIGSCLQSFQVYPVDTLDSQRRLTFHPDHPYKIWALEGDNARVYTSSLDSATYGNPKGIRTMSPHTVSFHYVKPAFMYMYDFLLYRLARHDETGKIVKASDGAAPSR